MTRRLESSPKQRRGKALAFLAASVRLEWKRYDAGSSICRDSAADSMMSQS